MENLVTNLELSKKLKELGVKQKSLFYWYQDLAKNDYIIRYRKSENNFENNIDWFLETNVAFSAFTAGELGELLPAKIKTDEEIYLTIFKSELNELKVSRWTAAYETTSYEQKPKLILRESDENMANALAKMLCYLIKNKLLTLPT